MKNTLEKLLESAAPPAKINSGDHKNLDEFLKYYAEDTGYKLGTISRLSAPISARKYLEDWNTIPYVIGILHRGQYDGYKPLQLIGLSNSEASEFQELCEKIRTKGHENCNGSHKKNTPTSSLYDQIIASGF